MQNSNAPTENAPQGAHGWRISLNLTRRIVRRMMELTEAENQNAARITPRQSQVPDANDFRTSLRLLRRTIRRTINHAELFGGMENAAA